MTNIDEQGNIIWEKMFSENNSYDPEEIISTIDGSFIIAGSSEDKGFLLKVDKNGNQLWEKAYPKEIYAKFYDIIELEDGNLIITGLHKINDTGVLWLIKTNSNGVMKWEKSMSKFENGFCWGHSLVFTTDKSIVISANTVNENKKLNTWIIKTRTK